MAVFQKEILPADPLVADKPPEISSAQDIPPEASIVSLPALSRSSQPVNELSSKADPRVKEVPSPVFPATSRA